MITSFPGPNGFQFFAGCPERTRLTPAVNDGTLSLSKVATTPSRQQSFSPAAAVRCRCRCGGAGAGAVSVH